MDYQNKIKQFYKKNPVTGTIIIINLLAFIFVLINGGFSPLNLIAHGALHPVLVLDNDEYYRLITVMFLHGGFFHFLMNSLALFYLGGQMEQLIGPKKYLSLYFVSGIGSSIAVIFLGGAVVTVGASGAIFGIIGGLLLLTFLRSNWFHPQSIKQIRNLTLINIVFTFLIPNISIAGHIGGLVVGIALFYFITPKLPYYFEKQNKIYVHE